MKIISNNSLNSFSNPYRLSSKQENPCVHNAYQPAFESNGEKPLKKIGLFFYNKMYKIPVFNKYVTESKRLAVEKFHITDDMHIDAFRHAWTSSAIAYKHGRLLAKALGDGCEYVNILSDLRDANMDLWNNGVGRKIGYNAKKAHLPIGDLPDLVKKVFDNGELIISPIEDSRTYKGIAFSVLKFFKQGRAKTAK